jgi:4-diphosphocytidyl-2-C-methyl-D-erythritol kinase
MDIKIQSIWYFCNKYNEMLVFPKAKINLGLRITGKRTDGYHDIETLFYPVNLCDALEIVTNTRDSGKDILTLTGYDLEEKPEENIVLRAVEKIREDFPVPFLRIHLHKNIPPGAGLGGGSSDAAFMLRAINRSFGLSMGTDELKTIAAGLGSDCPFFIDCQPSFASGRGEILSPSDSMLTGLYCVLINPGILISTREAYDECVPAVPDKPLSELTGKPVHQWKKLVTNDFEVTIFRKHPVVGTIKQALYDAGALYSSMSGSGSTVFGIFDKTPVIPDYLKKHEIYNGEL